MASLNEPIFENLYSSDSPHTDLAAEIDLTSNEDFSQFFSTDTNDHSPVEQTYVINYPQHYEALQNPFSEETAHDDGAITTENERNSKDGKDKSILQKTGNISRIVNQHLAGDHSYYTLSNFEMGALNNSISSPLKQNEKPTVSHESRSPGSDSGFCEETMSSVSVTKQPLPVSSSKLANLLQHSHVRPVNLPVGQSKRVQLTVGEGINDNPSLSQSNVHSQNVKYLIPVSVNSLKESKLNETVKVIKYSTGGVKKTNSPQFSLVNGTTSSGISTLPSLQPAPTTASHTTQLSPMFVLPIAPKKDGVKFVKITESSLTIPAQSVNKQIPVPSLPRLVKVLQSKTTNATPALNGNKKSTACVLTESCVNKPKESKLVQSCSESLRREVFKLTGQVSLKERKKQNAQRNIFMCPMCKQQFAVNRVLFQKDIRYVQGEPYYCINCCEQIQSS